MGSVPSRISSTISFYPKVFILLGILIAVGIIYGIYYGFSSAKKTATAEDIGNKLNASYQACDADMCAKKLCKDMAVCTGTVAKTIKQATTVVSGFTSGSGPSDELFVNMQPPTIAHAALNSDGSFDEDTAIIAALKGGIRAFTLQIDMLDKVKSEGFADPGEPTLLYRAPDGSIISKNSGDIGKVATAIANTAFKDTVPSNDEPIILYLHIVRAPNQITEDIQYKSYLGKIATALAPIAPVHLGTTATGNYHRQLQEEMILTTPLAQFGGNVIILCNADTSVFKGDSSTVQPADDLDYWVNMRVYALDSSDKNIGIAREYVGSGEPSAVITSLESISNLSEDKAIAFATKGKTRYVIAIPSTNPDKDTLRTATKTLGVNMVLLDYLSEEPDKAVEYIKYAYDKNIAWPQKSPALRSI